MSFSEQYFEILIRDDSKEILGDIIWETDSNHPRSLVFKTDIYSRVNYPIYLKGNFHFKRKTLSFSMIHQDVGRIYGLDMGQTHKNPSTGKKTGRVHKHRWTDLYRDKEAYVPPDITKPYNDVIGVWREFCLESKITHSGKMLGLPDGQQLNLF